MAITNWSGVLPNLTRTRVEGEYGSAVGYRILRNERGHIAVLLQELIADVVDRVGKELTALYNKGQTDKYTMKFSKFLTPSVKAHRQMVTGKEPVHVDEKAWTSSVWISCGLSFEEQRVALEKAIQIAGRVLLTSNIVIVIKNHKDQNELRPLIKQIMEAHLVANGAVIKHVTLPEPHASLDVSLLNCVAFTFLYLQDQDFLRDWKGQLESKDLFDGRYIEVLKKWKYRPVAVPKAGDLVVYIDDQGGSTNFILHPIICTLPTDIPRLRHIGIFQSNGRVLSKNGGINYPNIYEHDLDDVSAEYGNLIRFYRKNLLLPS